MKDARALMANRTVKDAHTIKGTNPQYLIEKITRTRIYESQYWKEECFALTAELLVDKAMALRYIGGTYGGNIKPSPFLCLLLKMLQIQPDKDIIIEFIRNEDFKYVRALGALYMRMTGTSLDCYNYLEPLLNDYRKVRVQGKTGGFDLTHMDEFIDSLLHEERACDVILPRIQKREILEDSNELEPRVSALEENMDDADFSDEEGEVKEIPKAASPHRPKEKRHLSPQQHRHHQRNRSPPSDQHRRARSRSPVARNAADRYDKRRRSPSKERRHRSRTPPSHKRTDDSRKKHKSDKVKRRSHSRERRSKDYYEIEEANAQRARLGLQPLRP